MKIRHKRTQSGGNTKLLYVSIDLKAFCKIALLIESDLLGNR